MKKDWIAKAELYDLLSKLLVLPSKDLIKDIVNGESYERASELINLNNLQVNPNIIKGLQDYVQDDEDELLHSLRVEYTRLFIGAKSPEVSPYGESWAARERGINPLMFIGEEALAVERFMRLCGVGHPNGKREPLDHISLELEFLKLLCLYRAEEIEVPKGYSVPESAYEDFYLKHFIHFSRKFSAAIKNNAQPGFYLAVSDILQSLPEKPL